MDAQGQARWQQRGAIPDFRGQLGEGGQRVSRTGDVVQFDFEASGKRPARFAGQDLRLTLGPPADKGLAGPVTTGSGLGISDRRNEEQPTLHGKPLSLERHEESFRLAIVPDGQRFLLGTSWSLRLFDRDGTERWQVATPGVTWAVTITPDGRTARRLRRRHNTLVSAAGWYGAAGAIPPYRRRALGVLDPGGVLPGLSGG